MSPHSRRHETIEGWCQNCNKKIELAGDAQRYKLAQFGRYVYILLLCRECDQAATIQKFRSLAEVWLGQMHSQWESRRVPD
jgi:RNase P subunit RPR2